MEERKQDKAKEYLKQNFALEQRIKSKIKQIDELNDLEDEAAYIKDGSKTDTCVQDILSLKATITNDIKEMIALKTDIANRIRNIDDAALQTVLELRYISFLSFKDISIQMGYGIDNVYRLHRKALEIIELP